MKKPLIFLMLLCLLSTASVLSSNGQNKLKQSQEPKKQTGVTLKGSQTGGTAQNLKAPSDGGCNWRPSGRTRYNFYLARVEEELVAYCTLNLFTGYQSQWVPVSSY